VHLYDHLFQVKNPEANVNDFIQNLNPHSLIIKKKCKLEPYLKDAKSGVGYQFLRIGYFCIDLDSNPNSLIFNRTTGLRDNWAKKK
jgi:glutaminyl-tRNA synthetase